MDNIYIIFQASVSSSAFKCIVNKTLYLFLTSVARLGSFPHNWATFYVSGR